LKSDAETAVFLSDLRPDAIEPNQQKVRS
jgi:hypothetical protein